MLWLKRLFIRVKKKHIINLIAEFNNNDKSLYQIARLTDYICNISDSVQIISDLQVHPAGYRISFKLEFETSLKDKRKGNKYTHYVANMSSWLSDDRCIQRFYYNYN